MNILAAILILGASGHAERSLESEQSIPGIVAGVVIGGVKDAANQIRVRRTVDNDTRGSRAAWARLQIMGLDKVSLRIDDEPRTGFRAWGEAVVRVVAYAADMRTVGSVRYAYGLRIRGYDIQRETRISDGYVTLTTDVWWTETVDITRRLTRKVPIHVRITIAATERGQTTHVVGTATGYADTRAFACPIVRRIAERQAAATLGSELPDVLLTIEQHGRGWYASGEMLPVIDRIGTTIRHSIRIGRIATTEPQPTRQRR